MTDEYDTRDAPRPYRPQPNTQSTPPPQKRRTLGAVVAAALLLGGMVALGGLGALAGGLILQAIGQAVVGGLIVVVGTLLTLGLWRGHRGAFVVGLIVAALGGMYGLYQATNGTPTVFRGVAILATGGGLLIVPVSSRQWFWG